LNGRHQNDAAQQFPFGADGRNGPKATIVEKAELSVQALDRSLLLPSRRTGSARRGVRNSLANQLFREIKDMT
jgi:hypothetical protein